MKSTSASLSRTAAHVVALLVLVTSVARSQTARDTILVGRALVVNHGCADCHGGANPVVEVKWLAGITGTMSIDIVEKKHFYTIDYALPAS